MFREQVEFHEARKARMSAARAQGGAEGRAALRTLQQELGVNLDVHEAALIVDLMLSYRLEAWTDMIALYELMPQTLKRQVLVPEQLAFALNRRAGASGDPADCRLAIAGPRRDRARAGAERRDLRSLGPHLQGPLGRDAAAESGNSKLTSDRCPPRLL